MIRRWWCGVASSLLQLVREELLHQLLLLLHLLHDQLLLGQQRALRVGERRRRGPRNLRLRRSLSELTLEAAVLIRQAHHPALQVLHVLLQLHAITCNQAAEPEFVDGA